MRGATRRGRSRRAYLEDGFCDWDEDGGAANLRHALARVRQRFGRYALDHDDDGASAVEHGFWPEGRTVTTPAALTLNRSVALVIASCRPIETTLEDVPTAGISRTSVARWTFSFARRPTLESPCPRPSPPAPSPSPALDHRRRELAAPSSIAIRRCSWEELGCGRAEAAWRRGPIDHDESRRYRSANVQRNCLANAPPGRRCLGRWPLRATSRRRPQVRQISHRRLPRAGEGTVRAVRRRDAATREPERAGRLRRRRFRRVARARYSIEARKSPHTKTVARARGRVDACRLVDRFVAEARARPIDLARERRQRRARARAVERSCSLHDPTSRARTSISGPLRVVYGGVMAVETARGSRDGDVRPDGWFRALAGATAAARDRAGRRESCTRTRRSRRRCVRGKGIGRVGARGEVRGGGTYGTAASMVGDASFGDKLKSLKLNLQAGQCREISTRRCTRRRPKRARRAGIDVAGGVDAEWRGTEFSPSSFVGVDSRKKRVILIDSRNVGGTRRR